MLSSKNAVSTQSLNAKDIRSILVNHKDFKNEQQKLIGFLKSKGHVALFLPKFHPELTPIERVRAISKNYAKAYCKYTLHSLCNTIPHALDLDNIQNFTRKARHYVFAYLEGHVAGGEL